MTDYVATDLSKKRAEIAGEIKWTHEHLRQLCRDLEHVDATLRVVALYLEVEAIRPAFRPPEDWSKRGEMSRVVLSILRMAREALKAREIAMRTIALRGSAADERMLRTMTKRVGSALWDQRDRARAVSNEGPGSHQLWTLAA